MNKPAKPKKLFKNEKWNECFTAFIASISNETTRYQYDRTLRRFFAFIAKKYGEQRTPEKIVQSDIEEFIRQPVTTPGARTGKPLSPFTQNAYIMALRALYEYCGHAEQEFRGKMVPVFRKQAPTEHIKLVRTGEVDRDFEEHEVKAFFSQIDTSTLMGKRDRALFLTLIGTGRRRREIASLLRGDLEQVVFSEGGRTRSGWLYHFLGKWRVTKESAEMPGVCLEAIRDFHHACGHDFDTMPKDQPLFFGLSGCATPDKPIKLSNVDRRFRVYARAAGIPDNIVVHSLRHEHAWTRYQLNGRDILEVKDALGHRDVKTTLHYIEKRKRRQHGDPIGGLVAAKFE